MTPESVYMVGQEAMMIAIKLTAPVLLPSLAVGLIIAMFQAATSINEMTLSYIPKLIVIALIMMWLGPWMMQTFLDYFKDLMHDIPSLIG